MKRTFPSMGDPSIFKKLPRRQRKDQRSPFQMWNFWDWCDMDQDDWVSPMACLPYYSWRHRLTLGCSDPKFHTEVVNSSASYLGSVSFDKTLLHLQQGDAFLCKIFEGHLPLSWIGGRTKIYETLLATFSYTAASSSANYNRKAKTRIDDGSTIAHSH